jgi:hypothetical protein
VDSSKLCGIASVPFDDFPDDDYWIVVPRWHEFQHYKDRNPTWIKVYAKLLNNPDYIELSLASKGLLQIIWLAYSQRGEQLTIKQLRHFVRPSLLGRPQLESLNHAGFIWFSASKPLAQETETETEKKDLPVDNSERNRQLLHRALHLAADWKGGPSYEFDEELDSLERELGARLPHSVRHQLWNEALKRERR